MRRTVYKVFWSWESDREERWLNEMSAKGMQLVGTKAFRYTFEDGEAGEYIYRIELLENLPTTKESMDYIHFLEDAGAEYIGSYIRWVYFRRKAAEGPFDLYSDLDSRIKQNNRILVLLIFAILPLLLVSLVTWFGHSGSLSDFQRGFTSGFSIVAIPVIIMVLLGAARVLNRRRQLAEEKKLRE